MTSYYQEEVQLSFYETDLNRDIRLPYLIALTMSVAGRNASQMGLSDLWLFESYQLVWVVVEHQMTINRLPICDESILVKTTIKSYNRYFCYREFGVYSSSGELLVMILSTFVLMDKEGRQLTPMPKELLVMFQEHFEKQKQVSPKLEPLDISLEKPIAIRYFDLDSNGHVNNSRYLEWVYDSFSLDFIKQHRPSQLRIKYMKEISPEQSVTRRTYRTEDVSQHDFWADGHLCTQVQINWKKR